MGIKGLFSILSAEPNRFGQRFVANKTVDVDIYIDAPALLYHLLHFHVQLTGNKDDGTRRSYPQLFESITLDSYHQRSRRSCSYTYSSLSLLPPKTIYDLTQAFCLTLKNSIGPNSNIHVVVDGVASMKKMKQQVDRLKSIAIKLDDLVQVCQTRLESGKVCWNSTPTMIPHLFGEDAMIQAVKDLQSIQSNNSCRDREGGGGRFAIHFAPWEAEGYIANVLIKKHRNMERGRQQIVLSNDTDFLVFPTITGIIPLHSLEYMRMSQNDKDSTDDDCDWNVHGWIFLREKFVRSFSLFGDEQKDNNIGGTSHDILIMSTIAALTGCDYTLSGKYMHRLNEATKTIVQSDIGGLRQKNRNNPSAKDTITAVIRFVSHFVSRYNKKSTNNDHLCVDSDDELWLTKLTEAVIQTESSSNRRGSKRKSKNTMKREEVYQEEQIQILKTSLHKIRDVYNDNCHESALSIFERSPTFHYMQELRRLLRHNTLFCKPVIEVKRFQSGDSNEESYRRGSLWAESAFLQCRSRICSLIQCAMNRKEGESNGIVTEYCCYNGANNSADYISSRIDIQSEVENCVLHLSSVSNEPISLVRYVFFGFHEEDVSGQIRHELNNITECHHNEHFVLFLASLLLNLDDALLLFLMTLTPILKQRTMDGFDQNIDTNALSMGAFVRSQSLIQIAAFHAKLGLETVQCILNNDEDRQMKELPAIELSCMYKIFCDDAMAAFLWVSVICTCRENIQYVGDEELSMILEDICYESNFENEHGKWQESIRYLWRMRQKFEEMRHHNN